MKLKPTFSKVIIKSEDGIIANLIVNGMDISDKVSKLSLTHEAGKMPILSLDLPVQSYEIDSIVKIKAKNNSTGSDNNARTGNCKRDKIYT